MVLVTDRTAGFDSDGYADNLSLILFALAGANVLDAGLDDTHTARIDWGDQSAVDFGFVQQERGSATILKDHTYADNVCNLAGSRS